MTTLANHPKPINDLFATVFRVLVSISLAVFAGCGGSDIELTAEEQDQLDTIAAHHQERLADTEALASDSLVEPATKAPTAPPSPIPRTVERPTGIYFELSARGRESYRSSSIGYWLRVLAGRSRYDEQGEYRFITYVNDFDDPVTIEVEVRSLLDLRLLAETVFPSYMKVEECLRAIEVRPRFSDGTTTTSALRLDVPPHWYEGEALTTHGVIREALLAQSTD